MITSVQNQKIKNLVKLKNKKYRDTTNTFLVEGHHMVTEALNSNLVIEIFTTDESYIHPLVEYITKDILQKISFTKTPQNIVAVCKKFTNTKYNDKILMLDNIQDPGNIGTLIRSATAFGFTTVVIDSGCDIYNDKVLRSTQGAIFKINIIQSDILQFCKSLNTYTIYSTSLNGELLTNIKKEDKICIILGNEGSGVKDEIINKYKSIYIKQNNVESLNVAIAGSIIMNHFKD